MAEEVRQQRRFGVTAQLTQRARHNLANLRASDELWNDLLDVIEMVCIEEETRLINTDPSEPKKVLANQRMALAAWRVFEHLQTKINAEVTAYYNSIQKPAAVPPLSDEDEFVESTINPLHQMPKDVAERLA